jgi:uncharacterized protein YqhQ
VDDAAVLFVLREADLAAELPRLGGMARPTGVAIVSERVMCFSDAGDRTLRVTAVPQVRGRAARLPFLRGLVKLFAALAPLFSRRSSTRRPEKLLMLAVLAAPLPLALLPSGDRVVVLPVLTIALAAWMLRGRTLRLHGAEHRAIAAAESRLLVAAWHGDARPTRFSARCGTNFAALLIPVSTLLDRFWVLPTAALTPMLVTLVALMVTMEIWLAVQRTPRRLGRLVVLPGLLLQRVTTREPTLADTRVALRAVAGVLDAHRR